MVYLDNAAASSPNKDVVSYFSQVVGEVFSNQEAIHSAAYDVRKRLKAAEVDCATLITNDKKTGVQWVNSGTEGITTVLTHPCFSKGNIVTTRAEHAALSEAIGRTKAEVRVVQLTDDGGIDLDHFSSLVDSNTVAVAIHMIQSETGRVQDLVALRKIIDTSQSKALFVIDTVQAVGKIVIPWKKAGIDICFAAGHKIGVPFGAAVLYNEKKTRLKSFFVKLRGDEHSLSRPEPAVVLAFVEGLKLAVQGMKDNVDRALILSEKLRSDLQNVVLPNGDKISLTLESNKTSPFIVHCTVPGFQAAVLVRFLGMKGVMISSGSACEAETPDPSRTLTAMGMDRAKAFSGLRISLWVDSNDDDIDTFLEKFKAVINEY